MDLTLIRKEKIKDGIFGELAELEIATLEHSYEVDSAFGIYEAKVPLGNYVCKRGIHRLARTGAFETFEVMGVPDHFGILFHIGNFNRDSEGCILLGETRYVAKDGSICLLHSAVAFDIFLEIQKGVDSFKLTIQDLN